MGYDEIHTSTKSALHAPPRELLTTDDVSTLAGLLSDLDYSGAKFTGTIQFKGHSIGLAYDSTQNRHCIGGF